MTADDAKERYFERLKRLLVRLGDDIQDGTGLVCSDPSEMFDEDDSAWTISCVPEGEDEDEGIEVEARIAFSENLDGGINFTIRACSFDGREVAHLTPFNFTSIQSNPIPGRQCRIRRLGLRRCKRCGGARSRSTGRRARMVRASNSGMG